MLNATALRKSIKVWADPHRTLLGAFGHALAFAVLFGGVALAAHTSGFFDTVESALVGALAILFVRLYARLIPRAQRLIDRLHPSASPAKPEFPNWAFAIYALIGLALIVVIITQLDSYTLTAVALFASWIAGHHLLKSFLARRDGTTAFATAFVTFDERLDAWRDRHWPVLRVLGIVLCFALLIGGVALHAYKSGLAQALGVRCGAKCSAVPGVAYFAAAMLGAAAILFIKLYATLTGGVQRKLIDPWMHVRPEPAPRAVARWAVILHVLIGLVVFFAIASFGHAEESELFHMSVERPGSRMTLDWRTLLALLLGWWIGGRGVLQFFWPPP